MLATLATIGSFILDLWQVGHWGGRSDQAPSTARPQTATPESKRPAIRETPAPDTAGCDLTIFAAVIAKLRKKKVQPDAPDADRFLRLGEDPTHIYIFDQVTGKPYCVPRSEPVTRLVLGTPADRSESNRREAIFWAVVVIVLASIGLVAVQLVRERR
ncbi:MAG: hypothetical protein WBP94_04430 [Rhodomicrobiaceae bacterium]